MYGNDVGKLGRWVVGGAIMVQNTGAMISYLQVVGDVGPHLADTFFPTAVLSFLLQADDKSMWVSRQTIMVMAMLVIIFPLASLRKISFLGYTSALSLIFLLFFAIVVGNLVDS